MDDQYFLNKTFIEAKKALKHNDVPVGCIIVDQNNKIIASAYNQRENKQNTLGHAELICINKACKKLKS